MPITRRPQPAHVKWPFTPATADAIEKCFNTLFRDIASTDDAVEVADIITGTATTGAFLRYTGTTAAWSTLILPNAATTGDIPYASATDTMSMLAGVATGNALISGGVATAPSWGKIGLTTHVTGTLPIANGGTNNTTYSSGSVMYYDGTKIAQDNSGLFFDASNDRLGVGAASPTEPLTVTHATASLVGAHFTNSAGFGAFRLYEGSSMLGTLQYVGSTFGTVARRNNLELFNMHATGDITFHVQGSTTPVATITDAGRFGVGVTTPAGAIGIVKTGAVTADSYGIHLSHDVTNTTTDEITKYGLYVSSTGTFTGSGGGSTTNYGIYVDQPTGADVNAAAVFNGNVGIGGNPSQLFFIRGNSGIVKYQALTGTNSIYQEWSNTSGAMLVGLDDSGGGFVFVGSTAYAGAIGTQGARDFHIATNNTVRMSINSGGVAAIGTTAFPSSGTAGLVFGDGTALASMGTNTAGLYADDVGGTVEMFGIGEGGNTAQLTGLNIRKTADESVTNSTTHQADDHLTVNLAASSSYAFELWGFWTTAGATAGISVQLDGTAGVSSLKADIAIVDAATNAFSAFDRVTAFNSAVGAGLSGSHTFYIKGVIEVSTAGTMFLEWAQNSADAVNATTVQENSYFVLRKLNA